MDPNPDVPNPVETFRLEAPSTLWVGAKAYPAQVFTETRKFTHPNLDDWAYYRRQARVNFPNRWGASIIWGSGSYSTNSFERLDMMGLPFVDEPELVEVGLLYDDCLVSDVVGYLPTGVVRLVLDDIKQWSPEMNQEFPVRWRALDAGLVRLLDDGHER